MKIASILPYKENYTKKGAGAVSLWISDFMKYSKYKKNITVFGLFVGLEDDILRLHGEGPREDAEASRRRGGARAARRRCRRW